MSIKSPTPEQLDAVEQGDRPATTRFVDEHIAIAQQLTWLHFGRLSREDCEEIAVDAMRDVIDGLSKYNRSKPFGPWFVTIVRRRGLDFLDKHKEEWTEGERGQISTQVSFEEASEDDAPRQLKEDLLNATARESTGDGVIISETAEAEVISPRIAAKITKLDAWMETLSHKERALLSHYTHGVSWEEIAAELAKLGDAVSPDTARVRGHRLIKERAKRELGPQIED
jgi:RNA polymerase sigma factor (sigma-70 family)